MKITDLKYDLSDENIAREPREVRLGKRDRGKMFIINRENKCQTDSLVKDLPSFLNPGDVLVLNNSKRVPGVLKGIIKNNKAEVEIQFVTLEEGEFALCRIYPTHHLTTGILIDAGNYVLQIAEVNLPPYNLYKLRITQGAFNDLLKERGTPISSFFYSAPWPNDYFNTFFASKEGSVESPLAGLHFTPELIQLLVDNGVGIAYVTLHSSGSWLPFLEDNIDEHQTQPEFFEVSVETCNLINHAKAAGHKIIACGSTSMRSIESSCNEAGLVIPQSGFSKLYIKPGYQFKVADHYFTNFHPYKTSLMVLDAAFCGPELLLQSYGIAKQRGYLFFEFGDAVLYL